ncbi:MAG: murein biosynthesis integral membrane protein MurJ [Candidatus Omnitrophota bacterium]
MSTNNSFEGATNREIGRSAGIIGLATLLSRLLGFARDVVIARLFGVYIYAQAFVIAFRIPNLLRDLVGEGATNAAFVPVFSEYRLKHTKEEFWELANVVLNLLLVILMAITIAGIIVAPLIVRIIAPGFVSDPQKLEATVRLTRIIFPYLLLISLAAYSMGILNSLKHFSIPAFSPCLLNISLILFSLLFGEGIKGLALGVLAGGVMQLGVQIPVLYKKGFRLKSPRRFNHPAAKAIGRLMAPRLLSSCIYQLNNFVDSIFGSLSWIVGEGGVAVLYFSYRLIQFPIGIFSNALSQAMLPTFSTQALGEERKDLTVTLSWGLRMVFFVMLPASAGLIALSKPIISVLFGAGKFDAYAINVTSRTLAFYSIGLAAYGANKVLQACFFALKDTVTPTKVSAAALVINAVLNAIFMFPFKIAGLALATSIAGVASFLFLFMILKKRLGDFNAKEIASSFMRILSASLCMGIVCYFASLLRINKFVNLGLALVLGVLSYISSCFIFKVNEMRQLYYWLTKAKS